ncbi:Na+/H+ antiporter subunit D [Tomitella cavernea]|uniref:Na+/H+ antiporter subunit D n=1 Tax=Tomitella cavernea TaxID=1387982 RepID=A0ABP9CW77_9ACTN|nr:Na+/H+ antiporter subunit D [Tomitella cavernea]
MTEEAAIEWLIPLPVLVPFLGAAATMTLGRHPRVQRMLSILVLALGTAVACALLVLADRNGITAIQVGGWQTPIGITLVNDRLSALMLVIAYVVLLAVMVYAVGQGIRDGDEHQPVSIFQPTYLVMAAGISNAFLAGDLFNLYVGFEVLLASSFVLLTLGASEDRVHAGVTYVMVSMLSSLVFLAGIAFTYAATGTLNLAQLAVRLSAVPEGVRIAIFAVFLVAFGIKAAVFPLSSWLPDSYPTAPAPITAVFAGLLTKVGVYAIIRAHTLLFPGGALDDVLLVAGLATMLFGIFGAIAQTDTKRLFSFTLVSHIGYMIFGIGLSTELGLTGAIYYVAHHIVVQTTLFLVVGLIERQAGSASLRRLGSLAAASPVLAVLYLIPALSLGGIPPFSGFIGKVTLLEAGVEAGTPLAWVLVAGAVVTSLLTLYAVMRVWTKAFWRSRDDAPEGDMVAARPSVLLDDVGDVALAERRDVGRMPSLMVGSTAALVLVGIALTVVAGPLIGYTERAADNLNDRSVYVGTVLGPEAAAELPEASGPAEHTGLSDASSSQPSTAGSVRQDSSASRPQPGGAAATEGAP